MIGKTVFASKLLALFLISLLAASCGGLIVKGYQGPELSSGQTASVGGSLYARIEKYDDRQMPSSGSVVVVAPGIHTLEINYTGQFYGSRYEYSKINAKVTFNALAGHRYVVYAAGGKGYRWFANVKDGDTGEDIARSGQLPVAVTWPSLFRD